MKYCAEYAALLDAYIDGELSETERARVAEHLASCPGCGAYVEDALTLRENFPDIDGTEVPEDFADTVVTAIRAGAAPQVELVPKSEEKKKTVRLTWRKALVPLAACLAIAAVSYGGRLARWGRIDKNFSASAAATAGAPAAQTASGGADSGAVTESAAEDQAEAPAEGRSADEIAGGTEGGAYAAASTKTARQVESASQENGIQSDAAPEADESPAAAAPAAPMNSMESAPEETSITVSLTEDQRRSLAEVLEACTLESSDAESMVYRLTEKQIDEVLSALEKQAIPASVQLSGGGPYRLYVNRISE